jgi:hypothetical protein
MMVTLAAVVFFAAIFCFFSQEFIRTVKRIFEIKGATLILPLAIASWFMYTFDYWFIWAIYYVRDVLQTILDFLIRIMPFTHGAYSVALIILLTFVSVVPVFLLSAVLKHRTYKPYAYPYITSTIIWITCCIVLLVV